MPSLALGSCVIAASNTALQASLSSSFFSLRQIVISSALGMNALQSLSTSGVHARRCSNVPCEREGTGEIVTDSKASGTHHCANDISRDTIHLFRPSTFIKDVPSCSESILHIIMADTDTRLPGRVLVARGRHLELSTPPEFFRASTRAADCADQRRRPVSPVSPRRRVRSNHQVIASLSKRLGRRSR